MMWKLKDGTFRYKPVLSFVLPVTLTVCDTRPISASWHFCHCPEVYCIVILEILLASVLNTVWLSYGFHVLEHFGWDVCLLLCLEDGGSNDDRSILNATYVHAVTSLKNRLNISSEPPRELLLFCRHVKLTRIVKFMDKIRQLLLSIEPRWLMPRMYCSHIGLLYYP